MTKSPPTFFSRVAKPRPHRRIDHFAPLARRPSWRHLPRSDHWTAVAAAAAGRRPALPWGDGADGAGEIGGAPANCCSSWVCTW